MAKALSVARQYTLGLWLTNHLADPYLDDKDIKELVESTGLAKSQIRTWLRNHRNRLNIKIDDQVQDIRRSVLASSSPSQSASPKTVSGPECRSPSASTSGSRTSTAGESPVPSAAQYHPLLLEWLSLLGGVIQARWKHTGEPAYITMANGARRAVSRHKVPVVPVQIFKDDAERERHTAPLSQLDEEEWVRQRADQVERQRKKAAEVRNKVTSAVRARNDRVSRGVVAQPVDIHAVRSARGTRGTRGSRGSKAGNTSATAGPRSVADILGQPDLSTLTMDSSVWGGALSLWQNAPLPGPLPPPPTPGRKGAEGEREGERTIQCHTPTPVPTPVAMSPAVSTRSMPFPFRDPASFSASLSLSRSQAPDIYSLPPPPSPPCLPADYRMSISPVGGKPLLDHTAQPSHLPMVDMSEPPLPGPSVYAQPLLSTRVCAQAPVPPRPGRRYIHVPSVVSESAQPVVPSSLLSSGPPKQRVKAVPEQDTPPDKVREGVSVSMVTPLDTGPYLSLPDINAPTKPTPPLAKRAAQW
ncbi:hypothetical protein KIPB_004836 [Kipferlia bialata]|uniref:Homeobox domain-containing protein n=1 Tax=Kipferlia bialata TaxID=797122 RepID=A0A9K3GIJ6_9EUKA|nr:hypothetical protein KIPB_004836 [Kipferlia bialata]|eukprot:g4836.t1